MLEFFVLLEKKPMWAPKQGYVIRSLLKVGFTSSREMISAGYRFYVV